MILVKYVNTDGQLLFQQWLLGKLLILRLMHLRQLYWLLLLGLSALLSGMITNLDFIACLNFQILFFERIYLNHIAINCWGLSADCYIVLQCCTCAHYFTGEVTYFWNSWLCSVCCGFYNNCSTCSSRTWNSFCNGSLGTCYGPR